MDYKIQIKYIEPVKAATIHYKGSIDKANKLMPNVFKSINGNANGALFFVTIHLIMRLELERWIYVSLQRKLQIVME